MARSQLNTFRKNLPQKIDILCVHEHKIRERHVGILEAIWPKLSPFWLLLVMTFMPRGTLESWLAKMAFGSNQP